MTKYRRSVNGEIVPFSAEDDAFFYRVQEEELLVSALKVRAKRDSLLTASDWTQVADAPVDQAAWATYRQTLRDVPQQSGFPENVAWPTKPE